MDNTMRRHIINNISGWIKQNGGDLLQELNTEFRSLSEEVEMLQTHEAEKLLKVLSVVLPKDEYEKRADLERFDGFNGRTPFWIDALQNTLLKKEYMCMLCNICGAHLHETSAQCHYGMTPIHERYQPTLSAHDVRRAMFSGEGLPPSPHEDMAPAARRAAARDIRRAAAQNARLRNAGLPPSPHEDMVRGRCRCCAPANAYGAFLRSGEWRGSETIESKLRQIGTHIHVLALQKISKNLLRMNEISIQISHIEQSQPLPESKPQSKPQLLTPDDVMKNNQAMMADEILGFGKYTSHTAKWVFDNDKQYVKWALTIREPKQRLQKFINYIQSQ